ncbi:TolB-like 6-bladed beta-propeller domain-containing protein [Algoriphagus halophytocola]|uniref:TolB-like 6-bladed beta-propeller domain-containing protein n=1 Tax=Algoriphagus halophytocola TaxID=2991499 RepID=A0ABY6MC80_9BACT|nr:TolB-like 6-bladed beta-propeller domain-containing protein [Algoriphagus sp. TR-M5]UZD21278.1 TolB-like 6-bladed beta-propeller domain-containing protein [Algoriphagus sp. TR-M5]
MKILNPFLLFIFLFSCATKNEEENHRIISLEDFKEISLNSEKHYFQEVINASSFALQGDKILISEYHNIPDESPRIHIINTSDWTYDKPKGRYGKGPLETFIPEFIVSRDTERFLVYDYNNRKISTFSINDTSLLATSDRKITNPNFGPMRLALTPNRNYLGVARENENKLLEFDLEGSLIAEYGEFEKLEERPELTKLQISLLSNGRFHGNPKNGIYVRASIYRDLLEIFDYKTKKFISVAGPDLNLPEFEYHQSEFGGMLSFEPDVHFKYQAVTVTNNYIFVLYSGFSQLDYSNTGSVAKEIRVFDLNGNPKWRLILDRSISGLGVNEKSNEIYGLTTDKDPGIAVFQIPDEALN